MDTIYQVMPNLTDDEYTELKNDIAERGVMVPIEFDEHGNVLDGHHRLKVCEELGIKDYPKVIRAGMTEEEKRTHARKLNMARRQLNQEQRRALIQAQLKETPEKSDRQIAEGLGVTNKTVAAQRRVLESTEEIPQLKTNIGADGKERPRVVQHKPVTVIYPEANITISDIDAEQPKKPHVAQNSGNNEWYTPADIIQAARDVMGGIDLDPASSDIANEVVKAGTYYTAETNGLDKEWFGNVWLNPPYSIELIGKFIYRLVVSRASYKQAIVLVNNATETKWFTALANVASAIVFPTSRVRFYMPDGATGAPLQGQALIYVGDNTERFLKIFSQFGWGCKIWSEAR